MLVLFLLLKNVKFKYTENIYILRISCKTVNLSLVIFTHWYGSYLIGFKCFASVCESVSNDNHRARWSRCMSNFGVVRYTTECLYLKYACLVET